MRVCVGVGVRYACMRLCVYASKGVCVYVCVCACVFTLEAYRYALKVNMTNEEEGMSVYL